MRGMWKVLGTSVVVAVVAMMLLSGWAAAAGSGYNLSYTSSQSCLVSDICLRSVSSTYSGSGLFMNVSFSVAGSVQAWSEDFAYWVWFGGTAETNASAWMLLAGNATSGTFEYAVDNSYGYDTINFTGNNASTASFEIPIGAIGPSSSYALDVYAWYSTSSSSAYDWLGTDYQQTSGSGGTGGGGTGGGGTGSGGSGNGSSPTTSSSGAGGLLTYAIIGVVVLVIVAVVALLLVSRRRKTPPPAMAPQPGMAPMGYAPPPPPGMAPPPPMGQMPPPPPPT
jgi:preprotein translocase subunit SecG